MKLEIRRVFPLRAKLPQFHEDEESVAASKPKHKFFENPASPSQFDCEDSPKSLIEEKGNKRKSNEFHILSDTNSEMNKSEHSSFSKVKLQPANVFSFEENCENSVLVHHYLSRSRREVQGSLFHIWYTACEAWLREW